MKKLFDWLLPATKRDLRRATDELGAQLIQLRGMVAQAAPAAPPNRNQKIAGELVPHHEDKVSPADLDELEESLGPDADHMELPEGLQPEGNEGSWGDGSGSPSSSAIVIDHSAGAAIDRRTHDLTVKCDDEFTIFAIERWNAPCPPANYAAKLRAVKLRALRQANMLCQQVSRQGNPCEHAMFAGWAYIGWKCPDSQGKAVIGAVIRFRCTGI